MDKQITLGSLFDGIGGFPLAGQRNGITAVWASEIEPFPIRVTKERFPDMKHLGDITKIKGSEIEPVDIVAGGSPCQDLSVAGKRAGLAGERSGLFMEQIRIIKELREHDKRTGRTDKHIRPRFMLWENVPGAFSSNKGEDFRAVLEETARVADETVTIPRPPKDKWNTSGCIMGNGWSIAWRILDAQYWGVPQRRRRIALVADFGGQSAPEILFKRESLRRYLAESGEAREGIASDVERSTDKAVTMLMREGCRGGGKGPLIQEDRSATLQCNNSQTLFAPKLYESHPNDSRVTGPCDVSPTVSRRYGTGGGNTPLVQCIEPGALSRGQGERVWDKCPTLRAEMGDNHPAIVQAIRTAQTGANGHGIADDVAHTLDGANGQAVHIPLHDPSPTLDASYYKGTGERNGIERQVVATYQKVTGPLMANSHPGSYTGQDAYNDMLIAKPTYSLDRASFNQGENAQYDFQISEDGKTQTVISRGPNAVAISPNYSVRRLTPLECERLQDYMDGWTNIPGITAVSSEELEFWREVWYFHDKMQAKYPDKVRPRKDKAILKWLKSPTSDSVQYKACGNSIAVVCYEYVLEGIKEIILQEE